MRFIQLSNIVRSVYINTYRIATGCTNWHIITLLLSTGQYFWAFIKYQLKFFTAFKFIESKYFNVRVSLVSCFHIIFWNYAFVGCPTVIQHLFLKTSWVVQFSVNGLEYKFGQLATYVHDFMSSAFFGSGNAFFVHYNGQST